MRGNARERGMELVVVKGLGLDFLSLHNFTIDHLGLQGKSCCINTKLTAKVPDS